MALAIKGIIEIEGHEITISNPDKLLWPELRITKMIFLQKLLGLSPYLIKYCKNRYLTTIRFPNGVNDKSFYQKNAPEPLPSYVQTAELGGIRYVELDSLPTLMWLGNLACLEFHSSFHYIASELPAEWILDIDPSLPEEPRIMHAVHLIGQVLEDLQIKSVPKTSGATGVQIFIPIRHGYTFAQLRSVGEFVARFLVLKYPKLFTIERYKKNRGDLIYIDYLQHWHGKTLSAPYTPRARPLATVSTPLYWDEVTSNIDAKDFNLLTIERRLVQTGDLMEKVKPQTLDHILSVIK